MQCLPPVFQRLSYCDNHRWGYTYSIFFDGNAFHGASTSASLFPPSLATNSTGCSSFSTTVDGVLTPLDNSTDAHGVMITDVVAGGFFLSHDVDASSVTGNLSVLPSVEAPMLTYRGVADEQNGNSWTMSFSSNEGAVAELVCITQDDFEGSCEVKLEKVVICCDVSVIFHVFDVSYPLSPSIVQLLSTTLGTASQTNILYVFPVDVAYMNTLASVCSLDIVSSSV